MKHLGLIISLIAATLCIPVCRAQFDGQWTHYMMNPGLYNPAAIGLDNDLNVHIAFREQWTGIHNAPSTMALHLGYPFRMGKKTDGIGLMMLNESIGLFKTQIFQGQFSHPFHLAGGQLHLGVQGGILQENFDSDGIYIPTSDYHNPSDPAIPDGQLEGMIPDLSAGLWYHHEKWYAGLSGLHLLGGKIKLNEKESTSERDKTVFPVSRTFYFAGGYNIGLKNPLLSLQPSVLLRSDLVSVQGDLSMLMNYDKKYWGGLNWRPGDGVGVLIGMSFEMGLSLGYSYDIPLYGPTDGSHEVLIAYRKKIDTSKINRKQKSVRLL